MKRGKLLTLPAEAVKTHIKIWQGPRE